MFSYTVIQWLFFFYFYCFFGWCFESVYVSVRQKKWVNRGFMKGPFLPLYGSGGILLLVVSRPFTAHWWAVYLAGCVGATVLEYFTGVSMEALFKVRYWDYSGQKLNFQGHICATSTLAWGGLTLLMAYGIHGPVERLVLAVPGTVLTVVTLALTFYIAGDFALSFKEAMDLRDVLIMMEKAKDEVARMQRRMEIRAVFSSDEWSARGRAFVRRIRNNPTMVSRKYKEAFEELKKKALAVKNAAEKTVHKKDGYASDDICASCGGACCKSNGCCLSPQDMRRMMDKDGFFMEGVSAQKDADAVEAWLRQSRCAIDSFSHAGGPFYFVRMRHKCFTFIGVDAMGECEALSDEGCALPFEERPKGGRYLEGKSDHSCVQHYTREDMIADWEPYQPALRRIWDKWHDRLMQDGTFDACEEAYMRYQREKNADPVRGEETEHGR